MSAVGVLALTLRCRVVDWSIEDADSTDWVVPLITVRLASCDERRCQRENSLSRIR